MDRDSTVYWGLNRLSAFSLSPEALSHRIAQHQRKGPILLVLDYDGTLVPIAAHPEEAVISHSTFQILEELQKNSAFQILLLSGRARAFLSHQLSKLPIDIAGEHGGIFLRSGSLQWELVFGNLNITSRASLVQKLSGLESSIPGSRLEQKELSLAWHYRNTTLTDEEAKACFSNVVSSYLSDDVEVLSGHKVLEVRSSKVGKDKFLLWYFRCFESELTDALCIGIGDDTTDEAMLGIINSRGGISIRVGSGKTCAQNRLADPDEVLRFLKLLSDQTVSETTPVPGNRAEGI